MSDIQDNAPSIKDLHATLFEPQDHLQRVIDQYETRIKRQDDYINKQLAEISSLRIDVVRSRYNKVRWYDVTQLLLSYSSFVAFFYMALITQNRAVEVFDFITSGILLFQVTWVVRGMLK